VRLGGGGGGSNFRNKEVKVVVELLVMYLWVMLEIFVVLRPRYFNKGDEEGNVPNG
jgi:hypothetical protein